MVSLKFVGRGYALLVLAFAACAVVPEETEEVEDTDAISEPLAAQDQARFAQALRVSAGQTKVRSVCELTWKLDAVKPVSITTSGIGGPSVTTTWTGNPISVPRLEVNGCGPGACELVVHWRGTGTNGSAMACDVTLDDGATRLVASSSGNALTVAGTPSATIVFNQDMRLAAVGSAVRGSAGFSQLSDLDSALVDSFQISRDGVPVASLPDDTAIGTGWPDQSLPIAFGRLVRGSDGSATRLKHLAPLGLGLEPGDALLYRGTFRQDADTAAFDVNVTNPAAGTGLKLTAADSAWTCNPGLFGSGACDCNCGLADPDCDPTQCAGCGDDVAAGPEACDGADLGGSSCIRQGFAAGLLACNSGCDGFDTSQCMMQAPCCISGGGPGCGADPAAEACVCATDPYCCDVFWDGACADEVEGLGCGLCQQPYCGDGAIDAPELCDQGDQGALGGSSCIRQGFDGGLLTCNGTCNGLDTSQCTYAPCCGPSAGPGCSADLDIEACVCAADPACCTDLWSPSCVDKVEGLGCGVCVDTPYCGDGTIDAPEQCEPGDLGGASCIGQGFNGGLLTCNGSCAFDTSQCTHAPCCGVGPEPGCSADPGIAACVCTVDPSCCDLTWGPSCVALVEDQACGVCADTPYCGDSAAEGLEQCDESDLGGSSCIRQGYDRGLLACNGTCDGYDTSSCIEDCCSEGGPGCALNPDVEACVCGVDPYCCNTEWDFICVDEVEEEGCGACGYAPYCGDGAADAPEQCDGLDLGGATCVSLGYAGGSLGCNVACTRDVSACIPVD